MTRHPRIVLVHGAAATGRIWRLVAKDLFELGYSVATPTRPCSGDLDTEIADMRANDALKDAVVVGVSGGATLAWEVASRYSDVAGVVAHEPAAGSLYPALLSAVGGIITDESMPMRTRAEQFGKGLYGERWEANELPEDAGRVLADYTMFAKFEPHDLALDPAHVMLTIGGNSPESRYAVAQAYEKRFGIPSAVVLGAAHCVQLEQPHIYARMISDFVSSL